MSSKPLEDLPPEPLQPEQPQPANVGGGSVWRGVGIGCGGYALFLILGVLIILALLDGSSYGPAEDAMEIIFSPWILAVFPVVAATLLTILRPTRRIGIGVFIAIAAVWLIVLGPCFTLIPN